MKLATASLGDVCEIVSGATPKTDTARFWGGDVPWTTPKDLSSLATPYLDRPSRTITEDGLKSCAARLLPANSVLLSSRAPIGLVAINTVPMATNQGFKSLVPSPGKLDSKFLYHWLKSKTGYLQSLGNGATFKELSKAIVERIEIPLPPLDEQRRIAAILDKADALRRKRKRALALLDGLTQSRYIAEFSSENRVLPLGEILEGIDSGWSPTCLDRAAIDGEAGVLKLSAVTQGSFKATENKAFPPGIAAKARDEVLRGDILFCRKNTKDLVGASTYVWETPPRLFISDLIFRLVPNPKMVDSIYLQAAVSAAEVRREISALSAGSAGSMPNISKAKLREVSIPMPDIEYQISFSEFIKATNIHRQQQVAGFVALEKFFSSLQHRAFTGQL